ncbi:MAG: RsmB/NOP family class I SAM-dependent RNA methyltransferase [Promethearchaeota archaeon]
MRRTISDYDSLKIEELARVFFITYRILWEKTSNSTITKDFKVFDKNFLNNIKMFSWGNALKTKNEIEKLSICEAIPSYMINLLLPVMTLDFLKKNIRYMNNLEKKSINFIRINRLGVIEREQDNYVEIKEELKNRNIKFKKDTHLPDLINVPRFLKSKIINTKLYQQGRIIFQDKASAAVVHTLSPQIGEKICDMCSAPGIKTSLIAQYMNNSGTIIAGEFLNYRILSMKKLMDHLKVLNTHLLNVDSINIPLRSDIKFDRILLDAPCTGSGTFLENPELKWRQNDNFLHQNITLQKKLFESALLLLKPGGILVYSVCSLYTEEGEYIISNFLDELIPLSLPQWFSPSYPINNYIIPGTGRLFPSIHKTQGFFIGKFKKKES